MWTRFVAFLNRQEPATSLAVFRMGVGLALVLTVGQVVWGGILDAVWVDRAYGGLHAIHPRGLVALLGGATPGNIHGLAAVSIGLGILLTLGLGGRLTAFMAVQVTRSLLHVNLYADAAYDSLLTNALWLCVLAPTTRTLSLDAWLETGSPVSTATVGVWARYLVVWQLVVMYTSTGWQKLSSTWVPGGDLSALYYILEMPSFILRDLPWLHRVYPLTQVGTLISWLWEVTGPLLLLAFWASEVPDRPQRVARWLVRARVRELYMAIGLVMHVSLLFLMELGPFGFTSLVFYAALVHPREWPWAGRGSQA
ncbi:MAG: HTTM domain-containing protein [Myxococcales bacterium]|nr:HTTM domain-containing protein [Myxococcales bacterium]